MKTCEYDGAPFTEARSHPWTDAVASVDFRYYDLKAEPARIRTSLEDFVPWARYPAVRAVYALLEWLNAPGGALETNDCAFTGPHPNEVAAFPKALQCSGRIMVLFRSLAENLSRGAIAALKDGLHIRLGAIDPHFSYGLIGTTIVPVRYVTLDLPEDEQQGHELMISFWSWGSNEAELMKNLGRVIANLSLGLRGHGDAAPPGSAER